MRPFTREAMKSSKAEGSASNGMVRAIEASFGGRMSVERRRHTSSCCARVGTSVELIPSRLTPRRMNGITVVFSAGLAASPMAATVPPNFIELNIQERTSPPRLSTAPA